MLLLFYGHLLKGLSKHTYLIKKIVEFTGANSFLCDALFSNNRLQKNFLELWFVTFHKSLRLFAALSATGCNNEMYRKPWDSHCSQSISLLQPVAARTANKHAD
jgi:hypothetical protein